VRLLGVTDRSGARQSAVLVAGALSDPTAPPRQAITTPRRVSWKLSRVDRPGEIAADRRWISFPSRQTPISKSPMRLWRRASRDGDKC
jgi:hypothetical protein